MYSISLQWKEVSVDLEAFQDWLEINASGFAGMCANEELKVHFSVEQTQEVKEAIEAYWAAVDGVHAIALSYRTRDQIEEAKADMKAALVNKSWDQMSAAERKMLLNMEVTKAELISAGLL